MIDRAHRLMLSCAASLLTAAAAFAGDGDGTRTLSFYHIHTQENLTVTYKRDGKYDAEALKKIDWFMRDWRANKAVEIDPKTIDIVWEMHTELGSKEPVNVICGHRSSGTNEMLRKTRGGQAKTSQHISGKAIDIAFPDVPARLLRYSAMIRERGGVGYYPTSAIPFVHVDTSRVRHWPNMPRHELALLFPSGHTQHRPAEGGSLSRSDVASARAKGGEAMTQVAAFYELRRNPQNRDIMVADASGTLPKLVSAPKAVERPKKLPVEAQQVALGSPTDGAANAPALVWKASPRPAEPKLVAEPRLVERTPAKLARAPTIVDRADLNALVAEATGTPAAPNTQVAALIPPVPGPTVKLSNGTWVASPEYDDDHPEELSYRPFPLAPLLTETASADDEALGAMSHPNFAQTLDLLTADMSAPPMRLRPGQQTAELLWSKEFSGQVVHLADLIPAADTAKPGGLNERLVKTSAR